MGIQKTYRAIEDRAPMLVLFLCLFLTGIGIWVSNESEKERDRLRFMLTAEAIEQNLQDRIDAYLGVLWAEVGLFQANDRQVDESKFRKFRIAADWGGRVDGLAGLAFVQKVEPENREAYVAKMKAKHPNFEIKPPGDPTKTVLSVTLVESLLTQGPKSYGFNPGSDPVRQTAINQAARTGDARMTDKIVLRGDQVAGREAPALIMYAPVYFSGAEMVPKNQREPLVYGFVSVAFHLDSLVQSMRATAPENQLGFRISSINEKGQAVVLAHTGDYQEGQLTDNHDLSVAGRRWTIDYWTLPTFFQSGDETYQVELVAFAGLLLSLTLYSLAVVQMKARRARELALHHERQRARDLEELDQAKTVFFSNLNHELRTPLNGILGMSDLLYDTNLDERQKDYLNSIAACGKALTDLVSDVLDLSKIRAEKMELKPSPVVLKGVFEHALHVVRGPAQGKGVKLSLDWDPDLPAIVELDEMRFRQVLVNLLGNAVKFTTQGSVTMRAKLDSPATLLFEVEDTGIGIAEDDVKLLFRPFSQVGRDNNVPDQKGTGLGLHLCKELLTLMDGELGVKSTLGSGTRFYGKIPLKPVDSNPYETQTIPSGMALPRCSLNILVVDDNPINRRVLSMQLDKLGQVPVLAENGRRALELVAEQEFDLVLMDCQMPEMDGLEATRRIRREFGDKHFIVALTAFAEESQRQACSEAGMNEFLTKPVDASKLRTLVENHCLGER